MKTLEELEQEKSNLLEEKAANTERLQEINLELKTKQSGSRFSKLQKERREIIGDNEEIVVDLRAINTEMKKHGAARGRGESDISLLVTLLAPQIAKLDKPTENQIVALTNKGRKTLAIIKSLID